MRTEKVSIYDTMSGLYVEVEVTEDVAQFMRRDYWREDMQRRRYEARKQLLENVSIKPYQVDEGRDYYIDKMIHELEVEEMLDEISRLPEKQRLLIRLVYFEGLTLTMAAKKIGYSISYASQLLKSAKAILRERISKEM